MSLAILVPVLRRPQNVEPLICSIEEATPRPFRVVFITDADDDAERDAVAVASALRPWVLEIACGGNYARKINVAVKLTSEPLLFFGADDLAFHPGWLEAAKRRLSTQVGVVGTNDLCNQRVIRGEHATHFLVTRAYAERGTIDDPGKVLHEGYSHCFCDDELIETARARGAYAHAGDSIVEHLHPRVGKSPDDEVYAAGMRHFHRDRRRFRTRRTQWA